jgi:hypothetical protein
MSMCEAIASSPRFLDDTRDLKKLEPAARAPVEAVKKPFGFQCF